VSEDKVGGRARVRGFADDCVFNGVLFVCLLHSLWPPITTPLPVPHNHTLTTDDATPATHPPKNSAISPIVHIAPAHPYIVNACCSHCIQRRMIKLPLFLSYPGRPFEIVNCRRSLRVIKDYTGGGSSVSEVATTMVYISSQSRILTAAISAFPRASLGYGPSSKSRQWSISSTGGEGGIQSKLLMMYRIQW